MSNVWPRGDRQGQKHREGHGLLWGSSPYSGGDVKDGASSRFQVGEDHEVKTPVLVSIGV